LCCLIARNELAIGYGCLGVLCPFFCLRAIAIASTINQGTLPAGIERELSAYPHRVPELPVLWVVTPGGLDLSGFPFGEAVRLLEY
jgi:predicted metal-dependent peptidase